MLSPKILDALNAQINAELHAFYTYLSMSAYFTDENFPGFAAWMRHHSDEEMVHAMKIYDFVNDRRGAVKLAAISAPRTEWANPLEAFEDALKHEQHVTALINNLVRLAREEGDYATDSFLQWFVDEQVEEEAIVDAKIQDLRHIGDSRSALFLMDRDMRAAQPEASDAT